MGPPEIFIRNYHYKILGFSLESGTDLKAVFSLFIFLLIFSFFIFHNRKSIYQKFSNLNLSSVKFWLLIWLTLSYLYLVVYLPNDSIPLKIDIAYDANGKQTSPKILNFNPKALDEVRNRYTFLGEKIAPSIQYRVTQQADLVFKYKLQGQEEIHEARVDGFFCQFDDSFKSVMYSRSFIDNADLSEVRQIISSVPNFLYFDFSCKTARYITGITVMHVTEGPLIPVSLEGVIMISLNKTLESIAVSLIYIFLVVLGLIRILKELNLIFLKNAKYFDM